MLGVPLVVGCRRTESVASPTVPSLREGTRIRLVSTVGGFGAGLRGTEANAPGVREIRIVDAGADVVELTWRETTREETSESVARRRAFRDNPPRTGVGEPDPKPPVADWIERQREGAVTLSQWQDSNALLLPALWPEGSQTLTGESLIWLSPAAFTELRGARRTRFGLGLLERSLPQGVSPRLAPALDALAERLREAADQRRRLADLEAERDFGSFSLKVNGRSVEVPTVVARSWFADYVILDDADNPLVLKLTLNPISAGPLDIFSPLALLKTLLGYQVVAIDG